MILIERILLLIILVSSIQIAAQCPETNPFCNATNNWIVGDSLNIRWNGAAFVPTLSRKNFTLESSSSFSDINGNLLLYTDGLNLYNSNDSIMITGLLGDKSSTQGSIIIPMGDNQFQIFTTPFTSKLNSFRPLSCSKIYLDKDSFSVQKSNIIIMNNSSEKLQACLSTNNKSNFLVAHNDFNSYYSFILKKDNSIECPVISKSGTDLSVNFPSQQGQLKISPSGKYFALATHFLKTIDFGLFNNEEGFVEIKKSWNLDETIYGLEFSSNERFIYATLEKSKLVQIDTYTDEIRVIGEIKNSAFVGIQKSPSNKIYISRVLEHYLDAIDHPDSSGFACSFVQKEVSLPSRVNYGLPNFNASYFYTPSIDFAYVEDCWEHTYSFEGRDTFDADGYKWIFEKSGYRDSILTKHCSYQFPDTGSWQVSHIAWNANRADTVTKTLTIRPKWQKDVLGKDTFYCRPFDSSQGDDKFKLTLQAPPNMHCVHWNGEEPNLDDALGPIIDYDHFHVDTFGVDTAGVYMVKLTNKTFCQMRDTIVVEEKPRPSKSVLSRSGNLIIGNVAASKYRWYYNGVLQQTTDSNFLDPNQNGYWQVQLVSEFGCESALSDSLLVDFASINLITNNPLTFNVYPNPSDGKFTIELAKDGLYAIQLFDIGGRLVSLSTDPKGGVSKTEQGKVRSINNQIILNLELASGSYVLSLTDENGNVGSKKIEINN